MPEIASCVMCECDDLHACVTDEGPCSWVIIDRKAGTGLCSACAGLVLNSAKECRQKQREYFQTKSRWALEAAKRAEEELDKMLEAIFRR